MKFDILGELGTLVKQGESFAEENWQICIAGVVALIGFIIYTLVIA